MTLFPEKALSLIASIIYYAIAIYLGGLVITDANHAVEAYTQMCALSGPEEQADLRWQKTWEKVSGGLYNRSGARQQTIVGLREEAKIFRTQATRSAWYLVILTGLFILPHVNSIGNNTTRMRLLTLQCCGVSLICLGVGLLAPVMSVVAYKDLPVLGHVIFKYDSKSIASTLLALWGGDRFLALLVLLFSILIPVTKLILTLIALFSRHGRIAKLLMVIGKWSMADVLLVAILLAVFSTGSDASTDSWLEPGLYFFAAYAILSMLASHALALVLKTEITGTSPEKAPTLSS